VIAQRTGALCFESDEDLERLLEQMLALDSVGLRQLAREQYEKVHAHFGAKFFSYHFLSLIQPPAMVP
jgi:hypothetical protein